MIQKKVELNFGNYIGERTLVHCNWGWGGDCDGYYEAKVFNLRNGATYQDTPIDSVGVQTVDAHYNWWYRVITYDNPNK